MPGPSSPKTKQKAQLAKEKQRRERPGSPILRPPRKDYRPADDCIIWELPEYLTEPEKHWWDEFVGKDKSFDQCRGPRGSHNGALAWTRGKFCTEWWPKFYPQYPNVSDDDKIYYFTNRKIRGQIYSYLHNTTQRQKDEAEDSSGKAGSSSKPKTSSFKPARLKKKVLAHDVWRRSNLGVYRARVDQYTAENGEPNFGRRRALSSEEYKELPAAERAKWEKKAKEELKKAREAAKLTDPNERAEFVKNYMKEFCIMLEDLEQIAGVKICALILHETLEGRYKLTRELSDGIKDFGKSPALVSSMGAFQKWYQDTADTTVDNPIPLPTVYPDYVNNYIPLLPDFAGITLDPARHLMRTYTNAVFRLQGAIGKVMWKEIKDDLDFWLDPTLLPGEFDDPSHLALPVVLAWLDFFRQGQRQEADAPTAPQLWFRRVPAGLNPINESESQEVAREEGTYKGKKSIILVFDRPVTRCHHPDGMNYSDDSLRYAEFLNSGSMEPDLDEIDLPEEWMGLPIPGTDTPEPLIPGGVKESLLDLANRLPEAQAQLVTRLLQAADEHAAHFPAMHPQGVYQDGERPPKLIPPSPDSDSWPISMWPHPDYFKHPLKAAPDGTIAQYELWQEHAAKVLAHEPSGTLYGGKSGIICVVRSLIQLLFTFSVVRGDFDPPEPMPEHYNAARFPVNMWPLLLEWIEGWVIAIESSTAILRKTFDERRQGLAALRSTIEDDELASHDRTPAFPSPSSPVRAKSADPAESSQAPATKKPIAQKRSALKSSVPNRKGKGPAVGSDEESKATVESEDGDHSCEVNFEELDCTSQDEMSDKDPGDDMEGELDDEFQPGDLLRIRVKYSYDVNLPQRIVHGTGSIKLSSYPGYSPTEFVFGQFANLPAHIPSRVTTPEGLAKLILAFKVEAKRMKDQYIKFGADNPKAPSDLRRQSLLASQKWVPAQFQPIFQWLFVVRNVWMRAQALAPLVFSQAAAIGYVLREGLQLHTIANSIIKKGVFTDPTLSRDSLKELLRDSKVLTVQLQWVLECLFSWNTFSSHYYNEMKGSFIRDQPPNTLTETAALCQATLEFHEQAMEMRKIMCQNLGKLWKAQLQYHSVLEDDTLPGFHYTFGAPDIEGIDITHLQSNLVHLRDALATSKIQDKVFEKSPASVTSTSTPDGNPPATTHSAAPHTSPALDGPHMAQALTKPAMPTTESPTATVETSPRIAETDAATDATGTSGPRTRPCPRPKMRPPPNTEPAEPPTANLGREDAPVEQLSGPQGSTEVLGTKPETAGLGAKRKRGPNSPKAPTRASARKRAQTGTQDNTRASSEAQETTAAGAPTPPTTRSQRKARNTGAMPGAMTRSLRPRNR